MTKNLVAYRVLPSDFIVFWDEKGEYDYNISIINYNQILETLIKKEIHRHGKM